MCVYTIIHLNYNIGFRVRTHIKTKTVGGGEGELERWKSFLKKYLNAPLQQLVPTQLSYSAGFIAKGS